MSTTNQFFATCAKGVEDLLQNELQQIQITQIKIRTGGVAFETDIGSAYKACLWSRVASRILYQLKEFDIDSDDDLYSEIISVDWSEHFSEDNTFAIDCFSSHSTVTNSHYATMRVKDAIVDQFMQNVQQRPSISRENPDIRINVYLSDSQCLLYLDLSGEALHKRGYRQNAGSAPLRETLAASMLYRAKWQSFYEKNLPLYDPMCGSGTLLIEAAMMAADIAPGLLREKLGIGFGFLRWKQHDSSSWLSALDEAEQRKCQGIKKLPMIVGSDNDEILVGITRKNILRAELPPSIKVSLQDATENLLPPTGRKGLIISNPPYGKRIGQVQLLRTMYYRFGKQLKANFSGWTAVIITSEKELARSIGLRAFRKNTLFNGAIISILYQYRIDSEPENINDDLSPVENVWDKAANKVKQKVDDKEIEKAGNAGKNRSSEHALMFLNRLKKNYKHLKKWARKNNISCYRVYDADIPQYAVAIDIYDKWIHVQEYQAPKTVDKNKAFQRINDVIDVVADVLETRQEYVVLKVRKRQEGTSQYQKQDRKDFKITVSENQLQFLVNMYDYIDTGLFLDHRVTRQLIKKMAAGKNFLNLFAYTGSVTVYAAAGNANTTTTVDMSNTYLDWARENMALNGYGETDAYAGSRSAYGKAAAKHCFIRDDCLRWMTDSIEKNKKYDLIFIDPPTFSNSKKMDTSLDINRDHVALLSGCLALLEENGIIIFSTNAKGFKLDQNLSDDCFIKEITNITTTEDFRRKPSHRCWCLAKQQASLKLPDSF